MNKMNISEQAPANIVGAFNIASNEDFTHGITSLLEGFKGSYDMDAVSDVSRILSVDTYREDYKERLLGDVMESSFNDAYMDLLPAKLEQLFENSSEEIVAESQMGALQPIVGLSLPILKKNYLECHAKDVVMTEIPDAPIIKNAFERKFLKDKSGNKHYIPEIFYDDSYKEVLEKSKGKAVSAKWYPETPGATFAIQGLEIMKESGGTIETRDSLDYDFHIKAIKVTVGAEEVVVDNLFIQGDKASKGAITHQFKATNAAGDVVEGLLSGQIDFYHGKVSLSSTVEGVIAVQFGGHLSNENNVETVELDREREIRTWEIPTGQRINTGITLEQVRDMKMLFNVDYTGELINDISTVLTQTEDSTIFGFLDDSLAKWRDRYDLPFGYNDGFTETYEFSALPPSNVFVPTSQWMEQLRYYLNRTVSKLKKKLKTNDIMFVIYGDPELIELIQDDVKWVIDEGTKVGGIQLEYRFGVLTKTQSRIHVVSSLKVDASKGLRIVAYPTSDQTMTFKHWKYSLNIENSYRNPFTPLTPNIMGTSRYLTSELLPVQGEMFITNGDFGRKTKKKPVI